MACRGCGFPIGDWSAEWHRRHEAAHLAAMGPNPEAGTRRNLRWFVELAEREEAAK